jgi:phage terminase large subunit-like protein
VSYVDRARSYCEGVLSGEIPACKYVAQACQRQVDDLAQSPSGYEFDEEKAARICAFVESFHHIKGPHASRGEKIRLEDWQIFILTTVFGWVDESGNRRFRRAYTEVPRGNGKSALSSPIGLYMLGFDGEAGAEVYSAATTRDQARIVFRDAQAMARKMPEKSRKRHGIEITAQAITQMRTASSFKALSADGHTLDGLNIHLAIVDELHAHKQRDVYDVLETGIGKRPQSLLWMITTAGTNKHGICYEVRDYALKVLNGAAKDASAEATFGIIYTVDEGDDPFDEATLRKANPNWGVSVDPNVVLQTAAKAQQTATARPNYVTKHLNVWVDANEALFDTEHWRRCEDKALDEADFAQDESVVALDLASKIDIAAKLNVYRRNIEGKDHYFVFPKFYLPRAAIEEDRHPMYRGWEMQGDIEATTGETIDFAVIEDEIRLEVPGRNIAAVVADPWQANYLVTNLQRDGYPAEEFRQTVANMSEATKTLDALMREGRIHHPGNAVLNWMIGNVVGHFDAKDNVYPRKELPANKIDGAVALIMAIGWFVQNKEMTAATPWDLDPEFSVVR